MDITTSRRIDYVLREVERNAGEIGAAVENLGIPLEDALCFFLRRCLHRSASDVHQPELFKERIGGPDTR